MKNEDDGFNIEFETQGNIGSGTNNIFQRTLLTSLRFYNLYKLIIFLSLAGGLIYTIFFSTDPDPKTDLATLSEKEYAILYPKYRDELFELVKQNKINYRLIDKLLSSGIYIDTQDEKGKTLLFYAVMNKSEPMIRHLLYKGADVMMKDNNGLSVIDYIDKTEDTKIYLQLFDAKIMQEERKAGKTQINISHFLDKQGNILSTTLNGQPYYGK